MNCVVCRSPLAVLELQNVELDHCLACGGIWLDSGELEMLIPEVQSQDSFFASFQESLARKEKVKCCPLCLKTMKKVLCGKSREIVIDQCQKGHGLWCDKGELKALLEQADPPSEEGKVLPWLRDVFGKNKT